MQSRILGEGVLDSPSSLVLVGDRIYVTEWFIGGRLSRLSLTQY